MDEYEDFFIEQVHAFGEHCQPEDACSTDGKCWTHSVWDYQTKDHMGLAWAGSRMRSDPNWTNGDLFAGDEQCCTISMKDPTIVEGYDLPRSWGQISNGTKGLHWVLVHGEFEAK